MTPPNTTHAELSQDMQKKLLAAAWEVQALAYAPYSNFAVGAVALMADGTTYSGCNIENASYGLTVCAERAAIFNAISHGRMNFVVIALVTNAPTPVKPCGACRQVIAEFSRADNPIMVLSAGADGPAVLEPITALLPDTFALL